MRYMIFFKGNAPCPGSIELHNRRWRSWIEELEKRGILENVLAYGKGQKPGERGLYPAGRKAGGLAGYIVVNVSTEEEAVEVAREAPSLTLNGPTFCGRMGDVKILGFQVC